MRSADGLSPRVRGNRGPGSVRGVGPGSIPARAGEPRLAVGKAAVGGVYPRACGGTLIVLLSAERLCGLSPRVRGNRGHQVQGDPRPGSIPARAGEPVRGFVFSPMGAVYPRACGGTDNRHRGAVIRHGLSPRVRGNLQYDVYDGQGLGSIPARAGEPPSCSSIRCPTRVYPRACGGTFTQSSMSCKASGLSPRVRGNQIARASATIRVGSIPARAGEPGHASVSTTLDMVYPRACGGTAFSADFRKCLHGLSPRVRGNPIWRSTGGSAPRSIPARAGEPGGCIVNRRHIQVYPRACGGTR